MRSEMCTSMDDHIKYILNIVNIVLTVHFTAVPNTHQIEPLIVLLHHHIFVIEFHQLCTRSVAVLTRFCLT